MPAHYPPSTRPRSGLLFGVGRRAVPALLLTALLVVAAVAGGPSPARAHGGEDHTHPSDEPAAPTAARPGPAAGPRTGIGAAGEAFELVATPDGEGRVWLYLANLSDNAPVTAATVEVEAAAEGGPPWTGVATATAPGIYRLDWVAPLAPGADVTVTVSAGGRLDLILLAGVHREPPPSVTAAEQAAAALANWPQSHSHLAAALTQPEARPVLAATAAAAGVAVLTALAGLWIRRKSKGGGRHARGVPAHKPPPPLVIALGLAAALTAPAPVLAHGGEDHGAPAATTPAPTAVPGRLLVMTKESQFLLGIRTTRAGPQAAADEARLVGRVAPDPAGYARLQPAQTARVVYDTDVPIPVPGQVVKAGQVLAVLDPNLSSLERTSQRSELYRVESDIAQAERQLARWERLGEAVARKDVDNARLDLARLRKEKAQIEGTALGQERLLAPVAGRVGDVHIVPGAVVTPADTLVEIVDPERLRVEAVLYDLTLAERIVGGRAASRLLPGRSFPLRLVGVAGRMSTEDQGLHLLFDVTEGARDLKLGLPVDVFAETGRTTLPVAVPRDALADGGGGTAPGRRAMVFVHVRPEAFEARPVTIGRVIGTQAEIVDGLAAGERVVVQGLAQLQAVR